MWMAAVRDIAIILLALESLIVGVLLCLLILQLRSLSRMFEEEIRPLLESANDTASTICGTSNFLSQTVVSPVVEILSSLTGVKRGLSTLSGIRRHGNAPGKPADESSDNAESW